MNAVILNTKCGKIKGIDFGEYFEFRGIRYATAERWKYPVITTKFNGMYDAIMFGKCSYQRRAFEDDEICNAFYHKEFRQNMNFEYSEDCLYLNIYAPKNAENAPVLLYIHGGSFTGGSSNEGHISGVEYAKRGVVFVSINYRLGPFGFCSHPDLTDEKGRCGNFGLYDQLAAIKWVKDNISSFGGNGDKITIMGQSAGAMSVDILLSTPVCKNWFGGAIMMSGGALQREVAKPLLPQKTKKFWDNIISKAGVNNIEELRCVDPKTLYYAWFEACKEDKLSMLYTMPVKDGKIITKNTFNMSTIPSDVSYMLGVTQTDMVPIVLEGVTKKFAKAIIKKGASCYVYNFNRDLPGDNSGAWHSSDLLYAFGTLGNNWRPFENIDYKISYQMLSAITAFAKTGNPNCAEIPDWQSGYAEPMRFCENTRCEKWDTKKLFKNTFSNNGAEF